MIASKKKPNKCPACGSNKVATILWGLPAFSPEMERDLKEGNIVLGGCIISHNDPIWQCVDCEVQIYKEGRNKNHSL